MRPVILRTFEPFALDMWAHEVSDWLRAGARVETKRKYCAGLYQKVVVSR